MSAGPSSFLVSGGPAGLAAGSPASTSAASVRLGRPWAVDDEDEDEGEDDEDGGVGHEEEEEEEDEDEDDEEDEDEEEDDEDEDEEADALDVGEEVTDDEEHSSSASGRRTDVDSRAKVAHSGREDAQQATDQVAAALDHEDDDGRSAAEADNGGRDDDADSDFDPESCADPAPRRARKRPRRKGGDLKSGIRLYVCGQCAKVFGTLSDLRPHVRTHTGERPLECRHPGCGMRFAHSSNRCAHERTHTGVKRYNCRFAGCDKVYAHTTSRKDHEDVVHKGLRPYECKHCGETFTARANMTRHVKDDCDMVPEGVRQRLVAATARRVEERKRRKRAREAGAGGGDKDGQGKLADGEDEGDESPGARRGKMGEAGAVAMQGASAAGAGDADGARAR